MQASLNENATMIFYVFCLIFLSFSSQLFFASCDIGIEKGAGLYSKFVKWILMKILHVKNK